MRTIIEIPDTQLEQVNRLCRYKKVSRAELIRQALERYLAGEQTKGLEDAFGLWGKGPDGVVMQRKLRSEWDNR